MLPKNGGGGKHHEQTVPMTEFILISSNIVYMVFSLTVSSSGDAWTVKSHASSMSLRW
jgi:hypothetical protein